MTSTNPRNEWATEAHASAYLERADTVPHRGEGEAELLAHLPVNVERVLDLGTGDGRLLALVLGARPGAVGVAVDFSPSMLEAARRRFEGDGRVEVLAHDLEDPLPDVGTFDAVVSSFAIHHCPDDRKRALYGEIFDRLDAGGAFLNLEHVASPTQRLHEEFLSVIDGPEDPSNILLDVETQLRWLREVGFDDVDCHWKWRELALLAGIKRR